MESIPDTRELLQHIPPKKSTTQSTRLDGICDHSQYRVHPGKLRPGGGNSNSFSFSPLMGGKKPPTRLTWWKLKKSSSPSKWIPSTLNSIQPAWLGQKIQGVFRFFPLEFTPPVNIGGFFQLNQKHMVENEGWLNPAQRFRSSRSHSRNHHQVGDQRTPKKIREVPSSTPEERIYGGRGKKSEKWGACWKGGIGTQEKKRYTPWKIHM